jgi:uncharacterized protein YqkB
MAVSQITKEDKEILMLEFVGIVNNVKDNIMQNSGYASSQEFQTQARRMARIMTTIEGCGCNGRGEQLRAMIEGLKKGNANVLTAFAPLIFKSFARDIGRFIKVL